MSDLNAQGGKIWMPPESPQNNASKPRERNILAAQMVNVLCVLAPMAIVAIGLTFVTTSLA